MNYGYPGVIHKAVTPLEDGMHYARTIPGVGEKVKVMFGRPKGTKVTEYEAPACRLRSNPRRAKINPDYPNLRLHKGVLHTPEGAIPVKQIGKGTFSTAYLTSEASPRVLIVTKEESLDKEMLADAYESAPRNPHLPKVERFGSMTDGRTVWAMPLYKAPLRKADDPKGWAEYLALKTCKEASWRSNQTGYDNNWTTYQCAVGARLRPAMLEALEILMSTAANYSNEFTFEFSPRNLATDAKGNLVLLDMLFDRDVLRRLRAQRAKYNGRG